MSAPPMLNRSVLHQLTAERMAQLCVGLNEAQERAVTADDTPLLVLAGAGTGKTRVLTTRIAWLLASGRARAHQIMAVTFTNKASQEMQERVAALLGPPAPSPEATAGVLSPAPETAGVLPPAPEKDDPRATAPMQWLGTFHSLSVRILRRHAELVGLRSSFTILDADDQKRLARQVIRNAGLDEKRWPARALAGALDGWKNKGYTPANLPAYAANSFAGRARRLYADYQARLKTMNAADFGDLIAHVVHIWQTHPDILTEQQARTPYLLVDEYQDTNTAQYLWLRLLAQKDKCLTCVGDDDQSIYGWRGAEVGNMLRFEKDFSPARLIRLERNYRSSHHILKTAEHLIAANKKRLGKKLWTERTGGARVRVRSCWDGDAEARHVSDEIEAMQHQSCRLNDMAILVRTSAQMRAFEDRFLVCDIPYRVIGGPRFYERAEIRDANAYLRLLAQPDNDLAFERIANRPRRGLGAQSLQRLHGLARQQQIPLARAAALLADSDEWPSATRNALARFLQQLERWRAQAQRVAHPRLAEQVLDESGYTAMWQNDKSADAPGRLDNLKELVRSMESFASLAEYLDHVALVMESDHNPSGDKISLMTLHAAKGLEFGIVFLPGWEEGLFPHARALAENGDAPLEEERRLAYVGLTRAKTQAHISFANSRRLHGSWQAASPSRFLDELPSEHCELADAPMREPEPRIMQPALAKPELVSFPAPQGGWTNGARVFHQKFGYGRVRDVDGTKLTVQFDKAGVKKVMDGFVQKADAV